MRKVQKLASVVVLATALLPSMLRAQSAPQETVPQAQTSNESRVAGLDLNQTSIGSNNTSTTLSETFLDLGNNKSLWVVAGQTYDQNLLTNSSDLGIKYVDGGRNLLRLTCRDDENAAGSFGVACGFDTEVYLNKTFTLLGDVSNPVANGKRYLDFGVGQQIKFDGKNSIFFIYSDRQNTNNYRTGYLFSGTKDLFSVLMDYKSGAKPVFTGFMSFEDKDRFILFYDPNAQNVSVVNLLTFGNRPLPMYAMTGFLREQLILTTRSVVDSDNTIVFPAWFFVSPAHKYGDVLRVSVSTDLIVKAVPGAYIDNAFMISGAGGNGWILTQNFTRNASPTKPGLSSTFYGAGVGRRWHPANLTAVLAGQSKGFTLNLSASF